MSFFDRENELLTPQRKGVILEALVRRLAEEAGYTDIVLRAKHSSLEYDVEGCGVLHESTSLVGEAKAHDSNISGQALAAFVGKLLPLTTTGRIEGLFVSTSPFTAEASDYLQDTQPRLATYNIALKTLVGTEIPAFFASNAGYIGDDVLRSRVAELYGLDVLDTWLMCGTTGDFLVATCGPNNIAAATSFALFKTDGTELNCDGCLIRRLQAQAADLAELAYIEPGAPLTADAVRADRLPDVAAGAGSLDYRFPAPPEFFIGRASALSEIGSLFDSVRTGATATRAIQVLSRSGVGKSSLLLKIPTALPGMFVTIDGRSLRTAADVRLLVTEAVLCVNSTLKPAHDVPEPRSLSEAGNSLEALGRLVSDSDEIIAIQIDQFESTLRLPAVFDAVLNLVETSLLRKLPVIWLLARKSDVAVTFDEGADVDLGRLNEISHSTRLDDFGPDESRVMFGQLEAQLGEAVRADLANAISTFSAGFPWLHKRLCAHVLAMKHGDVSQRDLVQAGLRAEDLFEDDLAVLTEQDRALLRRVAPHLPATASELATYLEAEINSGRLTEKLNQFLNTKLLRLAGDIYDAYNDVFKTYLVTNQIPFEARYVYRVSPGTAIRTLRRIQELGPLSLAEFQSRLGGSEIANLNKLRELRLLGLINPQAGRVELALETQEALDRDGLGELLRRRLRANGLVVRALDLVAASGEASFEQLAVELRREMPQVDVTEETWRLYARTLASWLHFAGLAQVGGDVITARELPVDESLQGRVLSRGAFATDTFVPSTRPAQLLAFFRLFADADKILRMQVSDMFGKTRAPGTIQDAVMLGLARDAGQYVVLGPQGRILKSSEREINVRDLAQLALAKPNVQALIEECGAATLTADGQRAVMERYGSARWTDGTWKWRLGILRAWLVATGLVTGGRAGLRRSRS